jgi:type II secretory pathway predicted ATPase ExeA
MIPYREFFAFIKEPFSQDVGVNELYQLKALGPCVDRFEYAVGIGASCVITGEIGSGKSTTLRLCASRLHPSKYKTIALIAHTGTFNELLKQIILSFGAECSTHSVSVLMKTARDLIMEVVQKKQVPVLLIDEAHLLRLDLFSQMHTLTQFEYDSKPLLPMILSGQNQLLDKLMSYQARPLASRVVGKTHLEALTLQEMTEYLIHHLRIAGINNGLFGENTALAIHQGSGGFPRRANLLAKGALIAAARDKSQVVNPEHVRLAATELI